MAALAELGVRGAHPRPRRTRSRTPSRSSRTASTPRTTRDCAQRFWRALVQVAPRLRRLPRPVPRQVQPGALLLGQLRSRGDALLRPRRRRRIPAACRTCPTAVAREAYSHEVSSAGFWPGGGPIAEPVVLLLRLSRAGRVPRRAGAAGGGALRHGPWASSCCPTTRCAPARRPRRRAARVPAEHLRGGGGAGGMGSRRAGTYDADALTVVSGAGLYPPLHHRRREVGKWSRARCCANFNEPLKIESLKLKAPRRGRGRRQGRRERRLPLRSVGAAGEAAGAAARVLGHEGAGIVEEVGKGVTTLKPGDHVVLSWVQNCGRATTASPARVHLCDRGPAVAMTGEENVFAKGDIDDRAHGRRRLVRRAHGGTRHRGDQDSRRRAARPRLPRRVRRDDRRRRGDQHREGAARADRRRVRLRRRRAQRHPGRGALPARRASSPSTSSQAKLELAKRVRRHRRRRRAGDGRRRRRRSASSPTASASTTRSR